MNDLIKRSILAAILTVMSCAAHAADPRCNTPPYGGTVIGYKAFVKNFGSVVVPTKILGGVCNAKFGGDRTGLYNLGFTDTEIDSRDTSDLAVDVVMAMKNLADHTR
jgi:hypothetical protein